MFVFLENLACLVFLKHPFWDSSFCLITDGIKIITTQQANIGPQDVPRTSHSNVPRTYPKDPIWPSRGRNDLMSQSDVLKWRPGDILIWRSRDVPGRLIRDVPRTFTGRPLEDLESTQTWMSNFFLTFLSDLIRLTESKSISTLKEYWEPSKLLRWSIFCKIS